MQCRVLAKSIGENSDLWEIEVQGRRGWAPKKMLREQKILIKTSNLVSIVEDQIDQKKVFALNPSTEENLSEVSFVDDNSNQNMDDSIENSKESGSHLVRSNSKTAGTFRSKRSNNNDKSILRTKFDIKTIFNIRTIDECFVPNTNQKDHLKVEKTDEISVDLDPSSLAKNPALSNDPSMSAVNVNITSSVGAPSKIEYDESFPINVYILDNSSETLVDTKHDEKMKNEVEKNKTPYGETDFDFGSSYTFPNEEDFDGQQTSRVGEKLIEESTCTIEDSNLSEMQPENEPEESVKKAIFETLVNEPEYSCYEKLTLILDILVNRVRTIFNLRDVQQRDVEEISSNRIVEDQKGFVDPSFDMFRDEDQNSSSSEQSTLGDYTCYKFVSHLATRFKEMSDIVIVLLSIGFILLIFIFGHNCLIKNIKEKHLIHKMNDVERKLFLSDKENSVARMKLVEIQRKLENITNMSFGTDDMIKQCENEKNELREHIITLEKELETAAEAGLELNKMVTELLEKSGSESIVNSVEELQKQLNDQEEATIYINNSLAEKSRENSELKVMMININESFSMKINQLNILITSLKEDKEQMEKEKNSIQMLGTQLRMQLEKKEYDIVKLREENNRIKNELEEIISKWQTSAAQVGILKGTLHSSNDFSLEEKQSIYDKIEANAKYLAAKKEIEHLKDCLNAETNSRNSLQDQIIDLNEDLTRLTLEVNQCDKQKLEAQTRLDVLSSYFKEKESQLQK